MVDHVTIEPGDPREERVAQLVDETFGPAFGGRYWDWKYRHPDARGNADIYGAEVDGALVAAVHYLWSDHRFGEGVVARSVIVGDLVVDPGHRGHGVAGGLSRYASETAGATEEPPSMILMWTRPRLGRFYTRVLGYRRAPAATIRYEKRLVRQADLEAAVGGGALDGLVSSRSSEAPAVRIDVDGAPPLVVSIAGERVHVSFDGDADLQISGPHRVVTAFLAGEERAKVWKQRLRRRLRVKGSTRARRGAAASGDVYRLALEAVLATSSGGSAGTGDQHQPRPRGG